MNPASSIGRTVKAKLFSALGIVLAFSLILSACSGKSSNGEPLPTSRTFNPTVKTEFEIDDWAWADRADQVISPDGKYALLILNNESGQSVAVTPIGERSTPLLRCIHLRWVRSTGFTTEPSDGPRPARRSSRLLATRTRGRIPVSAGSRFCQET